MEEARYFVLGTIKKIDWTSLWPDTKFSICDFGLGKDGLARWLVGGL
jgi:hypothetical protein